VRIERPFGPELVPEVALQKSPLISVLTQVRFPPVVSVSRPDFLAPFLEALRPVYPILREERQLGIVVTPQGVNALPQDGGFVWRLADVEGTWIVSIAQNFVALETKQYSSRADFFSRLRQVLVELDRHVHPNFYDRLGVRYINRIADQAWLSDLASFVRPEVLGLLSESASTSDVKARRGQAAVQYELEGRSLLVRVATVGAGETHDPLLEPAASDAWVLDLDMSATPRVPQRFDAVDLSVRGEGFAAEIYRYFCWAMTEEFVRRAGGKP
jgi:uncharacterized protein (TIGR04255 family)